MIAQSSTAAEYIAANETLLQAEWLVMTANEITAGHAPTLKLNMLIDNDPAIKRIKKDGTSNAQKAVKIRFHHVKDCNAK